jgi:ribosomal protein S12 methylthiotransferase accessory factor
MGNCLKDQGKFREAIDILQKGLNLDDERPDLHNMLGVCSYKLDNFTKAVEHFTRAVELAPSSAIDYANLGVNYNKLNDADQAIKNFEIALSLDPTIEFAQTQLAALQSS